MALGLERGSEANTPLGRAVIGGLLAGLATTLFVVPALYSLVIKDRPLVEDVFEIPDRPSHMQPAAGTPPADPLPT
jgi:hypothetical protein